MSGTLKSYYQLTKPGIIRGNAVAAVAGFFLASKSNIDLGLLFAAIAGLSLVIGSACVFNNYLDRDIDKLMSRTKNRALVKGSIGKRNALVYACSLGLAGSLILLVFTNALTAYVALFGLFAYAVIYGIAKRKTVHSTLIGSISGAVPPVVGYTSVSNEVDTAAIILFLILVFWQMPHFYGIALYRIKDYKAAGIPVLPLVSGIMATKIQILFYIVAFAVTAASLSFYGYTGSLHLAVVIVLSAIWLYAGLRGFKRQEGGPWGRKMFLVSLAVLLAVCTSISLDASLS